jgi:prefoldin subunit 5
VGLRSRLSWMISGPARIDELERSLRALQQQLDDLQRHQDATLEGVRTSVSAVLDDVTARLGALDADR